MNTNGAWHAGNTYLAQLSAATQWILRVDLTDFSGEYAYAVYTNFNVGGLATNYTLASLGIYSGTAGESLNTPHAGAQAKFLLGGTH